MSMIEQVWEKARLNRKRIVLPEGEEPRTVQAAAKVRDEGLAEPILLGNPAAVRAVAEKTGTNLNGIPVIDPSARQNTPLIIVDYTSYRNSFQSICNNIEISS